MRPVGRLVLAVVAATVLALTGSLVGLVTSPATAAYNTVPGRSWVPNGVVYDVARGDDVIYIAGDFTSLQDPATGTTATRQRVAALDAATGELLPWNPGANDTVRAIDAAGGTVYFGGEFSQANGEPATRIAAVGADGSAVPGWSAQVNNTVVRIVATPTAVYIGGQFGAVNGVQRPRLARLEPGTGALVSTFNAQVSGGRVNAIALSPDGTRLYLGGTFSQLRGQSRVFQGAVDPETGAVSTSWAPPARCDICHIFDMVADGDRVFAAVGGGGGRVLAWNENGGVAWQRRGDGDVQAIDVDSGIVYAGGHFGPLFEGQTRHMLVALAVSNGAVQGYRLPFTGSDFPGIWAVLADSSGLHIGGSFRFSGGNPARRYARMSYIVEPPSAPQDVTATAVGREVRVSWGAPVSDGGGIDRYRVFVSPRGNFADDQVCQVTRRSCTVPIGPDGLVEGQTYTFTVRALNSAGVGPLSAASAPVVADGVGPRTTVKQPRWRTVTGTTGQLRWTATDPSGVPEYRVATRSGVARKKGYGAWTTTFTTATSTTLAFAPGRTVCVKVRAVDGLGNLGPWSAVACRSTPTDDRAFKAKGTVKRLSGASYFGGTASRITGPKSELRLGKVLAKNASLVAWSCSTCGKVRVYYGKKLVKTVNLKGAAKQRVVALPATGKAGRKPMKVTLRPANKKPVVVDGVALLPR